MNEDGEIITEADHIASLLNSDGWKSVYGKLTNRILDLQNIANLDMTKPETLSIQLAARTMAVEHIMAWLKADVFGFVEAAKVNAEQPIQKEEAYIQTH